MGGASGYWGESDMAWAQLLAAAPDYLVFDYLAEITMSLMATMRARNPDTGYAPDFVTALAQHLPVIASQGTKIIANAGGVNPEGCATAVRKVVAAAGLDLTVSVVTGDDIMDRLDRISIVSEMFSGEAFPDPEAIISANAYLGAFPIARALAGGADIVITGRCVDSAVTLGALIHEFNWQPDDLDKLAQGSLVGHLIECGPQVTGGNFTDWQTVADSLVDIGYPIAEVDADGSCLITKPDNTGGVVNRGTVAEQMLYEIGDPETYALPDVICDFSHVDIMELGPDRVRVMGARGRGVPEQYKASLTVADGHRLSALFFMIGPDAAQKAELVYEAVLARARRTLRARNMPDYTAAELEMTGTDFYYGAFGTTRDPLEIAFRISVRHEDAAACALLLKEASGFGLATPPGLVLFSGARPKPQAVVRLFSAMIDKSIADVQVDGLSYRPAPSAAATAPSPEIPSEPNPQGDTAVNLATLAWLRSGDKGDKSNIGVIARKSEFMPYIWAALTEPIIRARFAHLVEGDIERWYLPGSQSMNILMDRALGGGGMASLRNDAQGKSFGQILAVMPILIPKSLL
ncbi:terpene utilization protein AtuA [Algimonas arctica]|uniref:Terpene utilization protein AtuA n=1 Tax=Algimonas arctica TaxID=1479486 RepID=A0A8J3G1P5_9PROT|nr:terpene utilization protein AtuA [Algimonas arctica]